MNTLELKNNFHRLINEIDNFSILSKFYILLEKASIDNNGQLWEKLSEDEKRELLQIDAEIDDSPFLVSSTKIWEKHRKWL